VGMQYGVPLETYVSKFTNMRFEPSGMTDDPDIRLASSILDYIFRRLALDFLPFDTRSAMGIHTASERTRHLETGSYLPAGDDDVDVEGLAQSAPRTVRASAESPPAERTGLAERTGPAERTGLAERTGPAERAEAGSSAARSAPGGAKPTSTGSSTTELIEAQQGRTADAPLCLSCGTKMRPAGSCYVCEGCGSTSGCS